MKVVLLAGLAALVAAGCPASFDFDAGIQENGCSNFLTYDAGAVGSAEQVLPVAKTAVTLWDRGLQLTGITGTVSPDGTDVDGGWLFSFGSLKQAGEAQVRPLAGITYVAGACTLVSGQAPILDWVVDSPAALAIAQDAGCMFPPRIVMQLVSDTDSASPLFGIDPAWIISGTSGDGGASGCVVDAVAGTFGVPDAGPDGGAADGGDAG